MLDPKWLDFLKTSGWQTTALAAASALIVFGHTSGLFPVPIPDWILVAAIVVGIVSACLALASWGGALWQATAGPRLIFRGWRADRKFKKRFVQYIPHMTPKERQIFAHLLHHNQRTFTAFHDGGYAAGLIGLGFIGWVTQNRQAVDPWAVPMGIPDTIWDALQEHRDQFPYTPERDSRGRPVELPPWRKPVL
jgi:hypothetical protein